MPRYDDPSDPERNARGEEPTEDQKRVHEEVLSGLEKILKVDRNAIADALDDLARTKRSPTLKDQTAERFGMSIANAGRAPIAVTTTDGETRELDRDEETHVAPTQFGLRKEVPNLPYHAIGVLANCFLNVRIVAKDSTTVRLDWTKLYQNAGLWGSLRLVKRATRGGETEVAPLRELKAELPLDSETVLEITGMGLGVDLLGEMGMLRRQVSTRQTGPAAAAAARERANAIRSGRGDREEP